MQDERDEQAAAVEVVKEQLRRNCKVLVTADNVVAARLIDRKNYVRMERDGVDMDSDEDLRPGDWLKIMAWAASRI